MTPGITSHILLIHGAIRRRSTYRWMNEMRDFFLQRGAPDVRLFFWSGRPTRGAIDRAVADLVTTLTRSYPLQDGPICVLAKSTGALVFRATLGKVPDNSLRFDTLLQVAAPNPPQTESALCRVRKIINLYSHNDQFLQFFLRFGPFYKGYSKVLKAPAGMPELAVANIEIPGIGHDLFNWNAAIPQNFWEGKRLYEVYYGLLTGAIDLKNLR